MRLFGIDIAGGLELFGRIHPKYKPAFDEFSEEQIASLALYFLPHKSQKDVLGVTRPRVVKWYCPFADQKHFSSGFRYCINVYAGCSHGCKYCYANSYEPENAKCKDGYKRKLCKDLDEIAEYGLPAGPIHLSNSTDAFQPLELTQRLSLYTLREIAKYRRYFTSITLLTKNPTILTDPEYIDVLQSLSELPADHPKKELFGKGKLPALRVEVSVAFGDEKNACFYDPGAPAIESRFKAIQTLRQNGIDVLLRIDPLLPRNPLRNGKRLADFRLPDAQSLDELNKLVAFAAENDLFRIVYSVAKIVVPRYKPMPDAMSRLKEVYDYIANGQKLIFRGGSWRLPDKLAQEHVAGPFVEICKSHGIEACFCKQNLLSTP